MTWSRRLGEGGFRQTTRGLPQGLQRGRRRAMAGVLACSVRAGVRQPSVTALVEHACVSPMDLSADQLAWGIARLLRLTQHLDLESHRAELVAVGAAVWYSADVHDMMLLHTRSDVAVAATLSNWLVKHCVSS